MKKSRNSICPFPWKYFFLCVLIVFLGRLDIVGVVFGFTIPIVCFRATLAGFETALILVPLILYHTIVYGVLKCITARRQVYASLFLLPGILLGAYSLYWDLPRVKAAAILSIAGLRSLPESIYDLMVYSWDLGLRGNWFFRFRAIPDDIHSFLELSTSTKEIKCEEYSKERMRLVAPHDFYERRREYFMSGHEYVPRSNSIPSWYKREIKEVGRRYVYDHDGFGVEVVVDDKEHIVIIFVNWG